MKWPWSSESLDKGSPAAEFDRLIDEIIEDFRDTVEIHERKLHELKDAIRDR